MKTFASREVQSHFGAVLDAAKREPVMVTQYGRPVVVMMNYEDALEARQALAMRRLAQRLQEMPTSSAAETLTDDDINRLVHELRA